MYYRSVRVDSVRIVKADWDNPVSEEYVEIKCGSARYNAMPSMIDKLKPLEGKKAKLMIQEDKKWGYEYVNWGMAI